MKNVVLAGLAVIVSMAVVSSSIAADKPAKERKGGRGNALQFKLPDTIELTAEQKTKVEELQEKFEPKAQEVNRKITQVMTPEQRKMRGEAQKTARAEGKKGAELQKAVDEALGLTAEQSEQLKTLRGELRTVQTEYREAVMTVLTDEQKAKLPQQKGKSKAKKKKVAA